MIGLGGVTVQAGSMDQTDIDKIREFIARCQWIFAKTMPWAPHEYIVRGKCPLSEDEFLYFIDMQRHFGVYEHWESTTIHTSTSMAISIGRWEHLLKKLL